MKDFWKCCIGFCLAFFLLPVSYSQSLIIGTTADNPPFASLADNKSNFYGFEIDIMMEICSRIQAQCQFQPILFNDTLKVFEQGKLDLAIATIIAPMFDSPEAEQFLFSAPYLLSSAQFLVRADSSIQTLQDIRYQKVGVRLSSLFGGTPFKDYIVSMYNKQLSVTMYYSMSDLIYALQNLVEKAVFTNTHTVNYWYTNNKDQFRLIGDPFPIGNGYVIMGKLGEGALITQINQTLYAMEQDGAYTRIYNRYFTL